MVLVLAAAVLSTLPVPEHPAPVVNELPATWDTPLCVTVDEVTAEREIDGPTPSPRRSICWITTYSQ